MFCPDIVQDQTDKSQSIEDHKLNICHRSGKIIPGKSHNTVTYSSCSAIIILTSVSIPAPITLPGGTTEISDIFDVLAGGEDEGTVRYHAF